MQKLRGTKEKKGREKEEEKKRKGGENRESNRKKNNKKNTGFYSAQSSFLGPIRNTLFRKKQFISTFVFMEDIIDE